MLRYCALPIIALVVAMPFHAAASEVKCATPLKKVYAIGSSTMGISLGPILKSQLRATGVRVRVWGKASSGLARPDFHDWVKEAPALMRRHRPDAVIVSLGTNDGQNIRDGRRWFGFGSSQYKRIYKRRVDALLRTLAGPGKRRPVVWLGPTSLPDRRGRARMKVVAGLIRQRISAFNAEGGHVSFVDGVRQTTDSRSGKLLRTVRVPGKTRRHAARARDNIHMTRVGVRWLLAEPILRRLRPCVGRRTASSR